MRSVLGLILLLGLGACGGTRLSLEPDPGPYDVLPATERPALRTARRAFEEGDLAAATTALGPVAARHPDHLATRAFLQEVELGMLGLGLPVEGVEPPSSPAEAVEALYTAYRARAEAAPTAADLVLAARLAGDGEVALELFTAAEELDPACVWIHYGRAFRLFAMRRFPEAREAVDRSRELDPGHLPTMRLHASMLASEGSTGTAIHVLTAWLDRTPGDPLVPPAMRAEAIVDLGALLVLDGEPRDALALLADLEDERLADRSRADLVRAAALHALDRLDLALAAARRGWELGSDSLLPLVQEAMLVAQTTNDPGAERAIWERLLEASAEDDEGASDDGGGGGGVDFQSLLIHLMAQTRLERLQASEPGLREPDDS